MREVVMHISEPISAKEATERLVKILYSSYVNSDLVITYNKAYL